MIKETIAKMRATLLESNEEMSINPIFETIVEGLIQNKKIIDGYLKYEAGQTFDEKMVREVFIEDKNNTYGNLEKPFLNNYGRVSTNMVPLGIVFVDVNYNLPLENYLQILKVCLETRNSIIIKPYAKFKTLEAIITIINDVLGQLAGVNKIEVVEEPIYTEDIDGVVYVGLKSKFEKLSGNYEKIFVGVGQYELYVDENIAPDVVEFAKQKNVQIFYPQEDVYGLINEAGANYCSAIMSGDKYKIREFIRRVKSSFVLVNMSPTMINRVNLFPEQLLKRKSIVIFE